MRLFPASFKDPAQALSLEWLETNGLGGFASQTVTGVHTRRYHGLLFAALRPPADRTLLLSTFVESLTIDDQSYELSRHRYKAGNLNESQYLTGFMLDPYPIWTYEIGDVEIEKSLFMIPGENAVVIQYRVIENLKKKPLALTLIPLMAFRDLHALKREDKSVRLTAQSDPSMLLIEHDGMTLALSHNASSIDSHEYWYRDFLLSEEQSRGHDCEEDLFSCASLTFALGKKEPAFIVADAQKRAWSKADIKAAEKKRRAIAEVGSRDAFTADLERAAKQFIVRRGNGKSIIAGYHWFTDWGRDTFISLPGLLLTQGEADATKEIVRTFLAHLSEGMIPNRFPEEGRVPEYNAVDATLWLFQGIRAIVDATDDTAFLEHIYPSLQEVIDWHERGTRYGIIVDPEDGLLKAGADGVALTWMDAVVSGRVITPRRGKPVEVNALWYNALCCMTEWSALLGDKYASAEYALKADTVRGNFRAAFWNASGKYLFDCIDQSGKPVDEIRPNQIFAISLRAGLLMREQQRGVLKIVTRELLTPVGLRSLAPSDPRYRGQYVGGPVERDEAYHQGTVWGWLIGPYCDALLTVNGETARAKRDVRMFIKGLRPQLSTAGIGQLSEIYDGAAPFTPRGCIAQAWSVAEVLRILDRL